MSREQFILVFWIVPGMLAFVPHLYSLRETVYNRRAAPDHTLLAYIGDGMIRLVVILMVKSALTITIGIIAISSPPNRSDMEIAWSTAAITIGLLLKEILAATISGGLARWLYRARRADGS